MKNPRFIFFGLTVLFLAPGFGFAQQIPTGVPISVDNILVFAQSIGGFLMIAGGILAGIAIILSGMVYLTAGGDPQKVKTAKGILIGGIIGTLIIFGSGVIIQTVRGLATNPFQFFQ